MRSQSSALRMSAAMAKSFRLPDAVDRGVERLAPARDHRHPRAFRGEHARDGEADALARAADDRDLAAKREIHSLTRLP